MFHCAQQYRREVRILLVGEKGVGKTSVILSLISEEFSEDGIPARSEEITIPPDVTPEMVPTVIADYSASEQNDAELADEINRAHVICVIYSVCDDATIEKVTSYWLPLIRSCLGKDHRTPVILVGNKIDAVDYTTMDMVVPLMTDYPEIETVIECSAKTLRNISELFYYAQKAVLHPTAPLYNSETKELTPKCKKALERVFTICDTNNDGLLDDMEMYGFQKYCYEVPLQPQALDSVKQVIMKNTPNGVQAGGGITLIGFQTLHLLFIQRGKHETTWTALRKFGYNDDLEVANDYLCPILNTPPGTTTELNQIGMDFFTSLFIKYDQDRDRCLSTDELNKLFSITPGIPWSPSMFQAVQTTGPNGWLTFNGYISQWVLTTLIDVNKTMEYMAYLGYPIHPGSNQLQAINVTREKKLDLAKKQSTRNLYKCLVIGAKGVGKSSICQGLLGRNCEATGKMYPDDLPRYVINSIQVYGQEKYLILQDIDLNRVLDILPKSEIFCDVACLVYDGSDPKSFEFIARTYLNYYSTLKIPILIVCNKTDKGEVLQDYMYQPSVFCSKYKLPPVHNLNMNSEKVEKELYVKLATMAAFPRFQAAWMVFYRSSQLGVGGEISSPFSSIWFKGGIGLAVFGTFLYAVYKYLQPIGQHSPSSTSTTVTSRKPWGK